MEKFKLVECLKEKCLYYDNMAEYTIDGCTYGCSEKDFEEERPCDKDKEKSNE